MAFSFKTFAGTCKILGEEKFVELAPEHNEEGKLSTMLCIHDVDADVAMRIIAAVGNPVVVSPAPVEQAEAAAVAKGEAKTEAKPKKRGRPKKAKPEVKAETIEVVDLDEEDEFAEEDEAGSNGVPAELKAMKKRRQIILFLQGKGFDTQKKIMTELKRVQDDVPYLAKMENLEDQFSRAMNIMKIGE